MDNISQLKYINAARNGNLAEMKKLVNEGVPIDCFSNGALLESCYFGHLNIVAYLVESKIDINKNKGLELVVAFSNRKINIAEYLLRKSIVEKYTPPNVIEKPIKEMVDYLIKEENYIKYSFAKNDRSIITWCENYIKKQMILNVFSEVKEEEMPKKVESYKIR